MEELLETENFTSSDLLFFFGGAGYNLIYAMDIDFLENWGPFNFVVPLAIGGISGIILYNILSAILTQTGKWLGGKGTMRQLKAAMAWSMPPLILLLPLALIVLGLLMYNTGETPDQISIGNYAISLSSLFLSVSTILFFYLGINTVAVAHRQNLFIAGLSYLLAVLLLFSPFIVIYGAWAFFAQS